MRDRLRDQLEVVLERRHADPQTCVELADGAAYAGRRRGEIAAALDEQLGQKLHARTSRHVHVVGIDLAEARDLRIAHDAHDLALAIRADDERLTERLLAGPVVARRRFADDAATGASPATSVSVNSRPRVSASPKHWK